MTLYTRARAAEQAAHDEAVAVVERWNGERSPSIHAVAGRALSRLWHKPGA